MLSNNAHSKRFNDVASGKLNKHKASSLSKSQSTKATYQNAFLKGNAAQPPT